MSVAALRKAVLDLETAHGLIKEELRNSHPAANPYTVRYADGRYVLLDGLTAIVKARAVLIEAETQGPS